jgi:lysophospholipase L1-like esterase
LFLKPRSGRQRLYRALALGLVLIFFFGFDFAVRRIYLAFEKKPAGRVADPVFDHGLRPNCAWTDRYGVYEAPYFSNSLGFRDSRIRDVPLTSERPRILLIGDSFTDGVGVPWEDTFAGQLEKALAPRGIEVLNAGCNSYTPILSKIKIRHLIENVGLEFDQVFLFLDMSDVKDELFYEEDAQGRARLIPYGPFASEAGWGTQVEEWSEISENWIEPNFVVLGAISRNLKLWLRKATRKELGKRGLFTNQAPPLWLLQWEDYDGPERAVIEAGVEKLKQSIGELAQFLWARGIPLTLVVYPYPFHVLQGHLDASVVKIWRPWCEKHGVSFIDLFPEFVGLGDGAQTVATYFLRGDCHWNAAGHRKVAWAVLQKSETLKAMTYPHPGLNISR